MENIYDLIIIGAGPAGISASIFAARQKLNFLLISKDFGGLANFIPDIETYIGYHYMSGYDLLKKFREHMKDYNIHMKLEEEVTDVVKEKNVFKIYTNKSIYYAKAIIVASGRGFKKLNVPGEKEFENKGLSYCAACDGPLFKDKIVAVIGGGKSGLLSTLFLLNIAKKIYLLEIRPEIGAPDISSDIVERVKNSLKVEIFTSAETLEIYGGSTVKGIKFKQKGEIKDLPVEGVFVEIGYVPHTHFLKNLKVKLNQRNEIIIDKNNMTNVKGVFAAGDVTDIPEKQVIVACGEGAKALMSVVRYLSSLKAK
ncbi:MAG: FAD-dependent oxidoreductase [Candidatus Aenigmatarchaeota archaeon]